MLHKVRKLPRWTVRRAEHVMAMAAIRSRASIERIQLERARIENLSGKDLPKNPLISITIATFNRADILVERTLPSVFGQTYQNFEVVIVGDQCTDDTGVRLAALRDPRIRFTNLAKRGNYPKQRTRQWKVAGSVPLNVALHSAAGAWIAHLDDDDCFLPDHLEKLLRFAQEHDREMAYSKMNKQFGLNDWIVLGRGLPFAGRNEAGSVPHSTALFRSYLRLFKYDTYSWLFDMAVDKQVWLRMGIAGVRAGFLDEITVTSPLRPGTTQAHDLAEDRT